MNFWCGRRLDLVDPPVFIRQKAELAPVGLARRCRRNGAIADPPVCATRLAGVSKKPTLTSTTLNVLSWSSLAALSISIKPYCL